MTIIMILTNAFSLDVRVYKEAKFLLTQGHDVEILCWDKAPEKGLLSDDIYDGIKIKRFGIPAIEGSGYKQLGAYISFIKKCKRYLKNTRYHVLHCHDMDGAIIGYLTGSKFIFDMHEFYDRGGILRRNLSHFIVCSLAKKSVANIYVSEKNVLAYGRGIKNKFFLLKNYSDRTMFHNTDKILSTNLRISYIGRVRNQVEEFTALFNAVKDMNNVQVNVYGDGPDLERIKSLAAMQENVVIHGSYNGVTDSEKIYRDTDISYVAYNPTNPNYKGEFEPVKLYEAIFTGTPIIATKGINPGNVAVEKQIGFAVNTRSSDEIRAAIDQLQENRDLIQSFKKNMKLIANQYDWNEAVKVLNIVYAKVI